MRVPDGYLQHLQHQSYLALRKLQETLVQEVASVSKPIVHTKAHIRLSLAA